MDESVKPEKDWAQEATAAAVAGARQIAFGSPPLMNMPVGQLNENQWGWIVAAALFGWIEARTRQAIAEGHDAEDYVRATGLNPDPADVAVVRAILPELADTAGIDWTEPLAAWPEAQMTNFLLLAWRLIDETRTLRDQGPGKILRPPASFNEKIGDPVPF